MDKLIATLTELEKLKTVQRGLNVGRRKESSAEHSWSCMLIADILLDLVDEPLDRLKVLEYLLYHDIVEVYAGDAKFNKPEELKSKHLKEKKAFNKIRSFIPNSDRFSRIFLEYENRKNREAEFAKAVDCLDACIRNLNETENMNEPGFTEELVRSRYTPHVSKFKITHEIFEIVISKLVQLEKL